MFFCFCGDDNHRQYEQNNRCKHICNLNDHWFRFTQLIWQNEKWIFHRPLWELRNGAENGTALKLWWQWRRDSNSILMYFVFPIVSRARMHTECLPDIEDYFLPPSFIIHLLVLVSPIKLFKNVDQKALDPALCDSVQNASNWSYVQQRLYRLILILTLIRFT